MKRSDRCASPSTLCILANSRMVGAFSRLITALTMKSQQSWCSVGTHPGVRGATAKSESALPSRAAEPAVPTLAMGYARACSRGRSASGR